MDTTTSPELEATCDPVDGMRHAVDPSKCNPAGPCLTCPGCPRCTPERLDVTLIDDRLSDPVATQRMMHERGDCSCGQGEGSEIDIGCALVVEVEHLRERIGRAVEGLDSGELVGDPERSIAILWPEREG